LRLYFKVHGRYCGRNATEIRTPWALSKLAQTFTTEGTLMNTIRMFAFIAAVLITALFTRVIADGLIAPNSIHVAAGTAASAKRTAD
jgi:hypothetical protein